jgi:hypothetical protein
VLSVRAVCSVLQCARRSEVLCAFSVRCMLRAAVCASLKCDACWVRPRCALRAAVCTMLQCTLQSYWGAVILLISGTAALHPYCLAAASQLLLYRAVILVSCRCDVMRCLPAAYRIRTRLACWVAIYLALTRVWRSWSHQPGGQSSKPSSHRLQ